MSAENLQAAVLEYTLHHAMSNPHEWSVFGIKIPLPGFLSLHALMLLFCAGLLFLLFIKLYRKDGKAPHGITNLLEVLVVFIRDQVAIPNLGAKDGRRFTPLLCSLFFFILGMNLLGLIPLFATATSNINVTAALAIVVFICMIGCAIMRHGPLGFIKSMIPHGVPWPVLIILIPIEFVGLLVKPFALTIRLFANMLAGHIVILSLLGLAVTIGLAAALPAVLMASGVYLLEILVAFLQAFIFTLLSAMFIGSLLHPAH